MKYNTFRGILALMFFAVSIQGIAQISTKDIVQNYHEELNLTDNQKVKFTAVIEKYNLELGKKTQSVNDFNTLLKKETLEIYKVLSPEQFAIYKKLKTSIEPSKIYRFKKN